MQLLGNTMRFLGVELKVIVSAIQGLKSGAKFSTARLNEGISGSDLLILTRRD